MENIVERLINHVVLYLSKHEEFTKDQITGWLLMEFPEILWVWEAETVKVIEIQKKGP